MAKGVVTYHAAKVVSGIDVASPHHRGRVDASVLAHGPVFLHLWERFVDSVRRTWEPVGLIVVVLGSERYRRPTIAWLAHGMGVNHYRVGTHVKLIVLPGRVAFLPEVGDVGNARHAVEVEVEIAMIMTVYKGHYRVRAYGVGDLIPVVDIGRLHGHVGDHEHGIAGLAVFLQDLPRVSYVFRCHMTEGHAHHGTRGEADKEYALVLEMETLVAENLHEVHASALAPVLVVVAFEYVPRLDELVKLALSYAQRRAVARVGDVARDEHEVDSRIVVYLRNRLPQVFGWLRRARGNMDVGDHGKAERLKCKGCGDRDKATRHYRRESFHVHAFELICHSIDMFHRAYCFLVRYCMMAFIMLSRTVSLFTDSNGKASTHVRQLSAALPPNTTPADMPFSG